MFAAAPRLTERMLWLRLFAPFAAGYFLSYLLRSVNALLSPELLRELHLSASDLGLLTSAYLLAFALAQIPIGVALDRYGPRRVESVLMLVAAAGAALFALGDSLLTLAIARGVIGLGVSACLMASIKGFSQWLPPARQASMTALIMAAGALGALSASLPMEALLPWLGWRGIFWLVCALCVLVAYGLWRYSPEHPGHDRQQSVWAAMCEVGRIFKSSALWRMAPHAAFVSGGFMALQGLWAVQWMMQAGGMARADAADHLFILGIGMLGGQFAIGVLVERWAEQGIPPLRMMHLGVGLMLVTEVCIISGIGPSRLQWLLLGMFAASSAQMYGVLNEHFDRRLAGRVSTALNLVAFVGAFAVQWGFGVLSDYLQGGSVVGAGAGAGSGALGGSLAGSYCTPQSLQCSFAVLVLLQAFGFLMLLRMPMLRSRSALHAMTDLSGERSSPP